MSEKTKSSWQKELRYILPIVLVVFLVFANSLSGEFVYDDLRQIVRNPLIQDSSLYLDAVTSDVWAFKGDGTMTASNYWRPTFTAFHILNFALFGLDPFGWHLLNILLHAGVCVFAFLLLRRWGLSEVVSFAITLIFAVHPVHTESVAWVSGSPDTLFGLFFLGSLWFADRFISDGKKHVNLIFALLFYVLALGAKEIAMLCFPIYFLIFNYRKSDSAEKFLESPKNLTGLFASLAIGFFLIRWYVLGMISRPAEGAVGLMDAVLSVPTASLFYLKQMVFPLVLAINYPLRPVNELSLLYFVLPLIVLAGVVFGLWKLYRLGFIYQTGIGLMVLPLLPTLNITAFGSEEIVHDRYLYLPLLGFLIIIFTLINRLAEGRFERSKLTILTAAIIIAGALAVKTISYNSVWSSNLHLWKHSVEIDPGSSASNAQYGAFLFEEQKYTESLEFYDRSIKIKPSAIALLGRGRAQIFLHQNEKAIEDLKGLINLPAADQNAYTLYQAFESLAIAYVNQKKFRDAESALETARLKLPIYRAALAEKLAIVYYQQGKKDEALRVLEGARAQAGVELLPESKNVFLRLGMLYAELGRRNDARTNLDEYLRYTASIKDKSTLDARKQAADLLKKL